jgi:hypothetical protein
MKKGLREKLELDWIETGEDIQPDHGESLRAPASSPTCQGIRVSPSCNAAQFLPSPANEYLDYSGNTVDLRYKQTWYFWALMLRLPT